MHARKIVIRFILWTLFLVSMIVLVIDLRWEAEENVLFYLLCVLSLVYRLLGCWFLPWVLHVVCLMYIVYYFVALKWRFVNRYNGVVCFVPVCIQLLVSLHLVVFRPGRSKSQRACRVGVHALMGVMIIITYYWMICFYINGSDGRCLLEMLYMFLYLCMILTPQFMTHGQAVMQASLDRTRHLRKELERNKGGLSYSGRDRETITDLLAAPRTMVGVVGEGSSSDLRPGRSGGKPRRSPPLAHSSKA